MEQVNLDELRSVEELANHQKSIRSRITELNSEFSGLPFPDEQRAEFAALKDTDEAIDKRVAELRARSSYVERIGSQPSNTEKVTDDLFRSMPKGGTREMDIYDLSTVRTSLTNPEAATGEIRNRALRAAEIATFAGSWKQTDEVRQHVTNLIENFDDEQGTIAKRILLTGSPAYKRAWTKATVGMPLENSEARALSLTAANGGYAVPFDLDPTVLGTSNGSVNPYRQISRVIPITGDEWRGVTSGAITTAYAAEATETTDNAPTLAQPTISTEKAQAFIPFSIEIGMDWGGLQGEMSRLLQESKDDLEADKFTSGSGTNEPFGVITGATNTVNATTGQTFDAEDLYRLEGQLPPRYRARASIVANRAIYNLTRQFDTNGGAQLWMTIGQGLPNSQTGALGQALLGYPTYEASSLASSAATGNKFMIIGDFSRFVIVDRVGLDVELIPHLVGSNHRPTGQRGLYAFWRNGSKVVDANAFRVLLGIA
jgi:HK97 family phage major capsid protein